MATSVDDGLSGRRDASCMNGRMADAGMLGLLYPWMVGCTDALNWDAGMSGYMKHFFVLKYN